MVAKTYSATLSGLEIIKIEVEVDGRRGVPGLHIIGLPSRAVSEAKQRVTAAIQNLGIRIKSLKTLINLAPVDLRKEMPHLDLAMALGLLSMYGLVKIDVSRILLLGELSLDGQLKAVKGCAQLVQAAQSLEFDHILVPAANSREVSLLGVTNVQQASHIQEVLAWAQGHRQLPVVIPQMAPQVPVSTQIFDSVIGQTQAKRALVIAAVGKHHLLMTGSPGIGKTLLAQSLVELLPPLSPSELQEVMGIASLSHTNFQNQRPFRSPHHTTTLRSLIGGGQQAAPGEITLAHQGVLFLDELAEFPRSHLEALRQPLESQSISFVKRGRNLTYPAKFMLIAATNPCPCGYAHSQLHACRCSMGERQRYLHKLSGPLLDRIDLHVTLEESSQPTNQLSSAQARQQIQAAIHHRQSHSPKLTSKAEKLLDQASKQLGLSQRSQTKTISIATSLAHLSQDSHIQADYIAEALQFRPTLPT